jgi:hypothetical protein
VGFSAAGSTSGSLKILTIKTLGKHDTAKKKDHKDEKKKKKKSCCEKYKKGKRCKNCPLA